MKPTIDKEIILNSQEHFSQIIKEQNKNLKKKTSNRNPKKTFISSCLLTATLMCVAIFLHHVNNISDQSNDIISNAKVLTSYSYGKSSLGHNQNIINLAKQINQHENMSKQDKVISLLFLVGKAKVNIVETSNLEPNLEFYLKNAHFDPKNAKKYDEKQKQFISPEELEIHNKQFLQLMKYYHELPEAEPDTLDIIGNQINKLVYYSQTFISKKIAKDLYLLKLMAENNHEFKEIHRSGFNMIEFIKDKENYWKENFASNYGKEIPTYLNEYYFHDEIDPVKIETFVNKYK